MIDAYNRRYGKKAPLQTRSTFCGYRGQGASRLGIHGTFRLPVTKRQGKGRTAGVCHTYARSRGVSGKDRSKDEAFSRNHTTVGEDSKGPAGMKCQGIRRDCRIQYTDTTRARLELRLGVLKIEYRVLLRWDSTSGKIVVMVLRKMCHDSFYSKTTNQPCCKRSTATNNNVTRTEREPPPLVIRTMVGNYAIYQRKLGT
jgi:hypothetical protein